LDVVEPNQPNTLDGCSDGTTGRYHLDESLDRVTVISDTGCKLEANGTAYVKAKVYAWSSGVNDRADFYYNSGDENSPVWSVIAVNIPPGGGGVRTISSPNFTLSDSLVHSVRVIFRYQGSPMLCPEGAYDDADDLVFNVAAATAPSSTS